MKNIKTKITAGLIALTTSLTMAQTANADQGKWGCPQIVDT